MNTLEHDEAFGLACKAGHLAIVDMFLSLEGSHSIHTWTGFCRGVEKSIQSCQGEVFERLLPNVCEHPGGFDHIADGAPLSLACRHGSLAIVMLLALLKGKHAQDVNEHEGLPLKCACKGGHYHIV